MAIILSASSRSCPKTPSLLVRESHERTYTEESVSDILITLGDFQSEIYQQNTNSYQPDQTVFIHINVDETFDNDHRVVSQKAPPKGRFTFSAADSGEHRICFSAESGPRLGWPNSYQGDIKFTLDLAIGETSQIESTDKGKISDIAQKVKDLNGRLQDIRREQVFQRVGSNFRFFVLCLLVVTLLAYIPVIRHLVLTPIQGTRSRVSGPV